VGQGRCQITEYSGLSDGTCKFLQVIFLFLLAYLSHTTNQRSRPFGYLLYLLGYVHQDTILCFLESVVA
jgi:hypothetical protein